MKLLDKIFGSYSDRELKRIYPIADAIENGLIGGFATDVYSVEPLQENSPLQRIKDFEK